MWRGMVLMIVLLLLICILFYTSIPGMVVWGGFGGHIHPEFTCNEGVGGGGSRAAYFFAHSCCRQNECPARTMSTASPDHSKGGTGIE